MTFLVGSLALFVSVGLAGMLIFTLLNLATYTRLQPVSPPHQAKKPLLSILIPARDEADQIGSTLTALLQQSVLPLEILVLDDHSEDGTAQIAHGIGAIHPQVRVMAGAPLPPGWLGKNWACWQMAQEAQGDILLFTDADVAWQPQALAAALHEMERSQADLLAIWPTQQTESWPERLVVPLMALVVLGYLPWILVHHTIYPLFAAANGQALLFRRRAYLTLGGHQSVQGNVLEDVALARRVKRAGLRLRMADGNHLITCRMYSDWTQVRDGYAKNILAGYGNSLGGLAAATLFHWLIFWGPWLLLILPGTPGWPIWPLLLIGIGLLVRGLTAWGMGQRVADALLMPLSVLLMTRIAAQALFWRWRYGGPRWKGRILIHDRQS